MKSCILARIARLPPSSCKAAARGRPSSCVQQGCLRVLRSYALLSAVVAHSRQRSGHRGNSLFPVFSFYVVLYRSTVFWTPLGLKLCGLGQGTTLLLSHLGGCFISMPPNE